MDAKLHVAVVSARLRVTGTDESGDVRVVRELVDLLMAVGDEQQMVVLFDARAPSIDLPFFARIARDFPSRIAILVRDGGEAAQATLYENGVYRAHCYAPAPDAVCDAREAPLVLATRTVLDAVRRRLDAPQTIPVADVG